MVRWTKKCNLNNVNIALIIIAASNEGILYIEINTNEQDKG